MSNIIKLTKAMEARLPRRQVIEAKYSLICDRLSLDQYRLIMGGEMDYVSKLQRIKKVTTNVKTLVMVNELLIELIVNPLVGSQEVA